MPIRLPKKSPSGQPSPLYSARKHEFFAVRELALRWGVSQRHIRRLIDEGELIIHRFGKAVRVSYANVLIYEAGCTKVA